MKGQHFFFATLADLSPGLEELEGKWTLECCLHETRCDKAFPVYAPLRAMPGLAVSARGDTAQDHDYFVFPKGKRPPVRAIALRDGGRNYVLDASPETVHFRSGGMHEPSAAIVAGRIARSVRASPRGDAIYKSMSQGLLRGFNKVGSFWVGPQAYQELRAGRRLVTIGIRSPREYDLSEERRGPTTG